MMVQTAVIQIDGAAGSHAVIRNTHLGVTKARGPLINPHTVFDQAGIERTGNAVDQFFIRNTRGNDPHIHTALGCQGQCLRHFIRNDQIRCHKPAVTLRLVCHADIHVFAHLFIVHGAVRIGLNKALLLCLIRNVRQISVQISIIRIVGPDGIPHLQKCYRQRTHRISFQADTRILPIAIRMRHIKIFVGQIITAGETDFSIYHRDFSMVTVI